MALTEKERNEIAIEVANFWKNNCLDEEFYDNCCDTVYEQLENWYTLKEDEFNNEYDIIMNLINNLYSQDNYMARLLFEKTDTIIIQNEPIIINNILFNNIWSIEKNGGEVSLKNADNKEIACIGYSDIIDIKR